MTVSSKLHSRQSSRPQKLSVCIVVFKPDITTLNITLTSLRKCVRALADIELILVIVDNSPTDNLSVWLETHFADLHPELITGHGNIGFGRANNKALDRLGDIHLVLNPDVKMASDCLTSGLQFLNDNPECGLVTPFARGFDRKRQFLCKRFPAVFDLLMRGFAPLSLQRLFRKRLSRYEMADMPANEVYWDPPIVSGCFMLFRGEIFRKLGGFDPTYFLYFEDFDLALRAGKEARIAYVPQMRILHGGGNAGRKGFWHIRQFAFSAVIFYRKFGLKLL